MNFKIRKGIYETASSSIHTITIMNDDDFDNWKDSEKYICKWNDDGVIYSKEDIIEMAKDFCIKYEYDYSDDMLFDFIRDEGFVTYEEYFEEYDYETYIEEFTTKNGDKIVAFGKYGHD